MKKELLKRISEEEDKLNEMDVSGHIWWHTFRQFVEQCPDDSEEVEMMAHDLAQSVMSHLSKDVIPKDTFNEIATKVCRLDARLQTNRISNVQTNKDS